MSALRVAIIGCGAVTEFVHAPVIAKSDGVVLSALVDKSPERAQELARKHEVKRVASDASEIIGDVDAAVLAVPHHLHSPLSQTLLQSGIHTLVEKPMAMNAAECAQMLKAAKAGKALLAVGMARRFYPASQFIKSVLDSGQLGKITHFDFREGSLYNWPAASDFIFKKESGGGVLADTGSHVLDLLLWWLGDFKGVEYFDDAFGGVEANCELHLKLKSGATGFVEFSRTRDLRNTYIIEGEKGELQVEGNYDPEIRLRLKGHDFRFQGSMHANDDSDFQPNDVFARQFEDFVDAIRTGRQPLVSGQEGSRVVTLIEACHEARQPLHLPWVHLSGQTTNRAA